MTEDTLGTVRSLLETVLEGTEDAEHRYKLRTALQLLLAHQDELERLDEAADGDEELAERLRELGYLD